MEILWLATQGWLANYHTYSQTTTLIRRSSAKKDGAILTGTNLTGTGWRCPRMRTD